MEQVRQVYLKMNLHIPQFKFGELLESIEHPNICSGKVTVVEE